MEWIGRDLDRQAPAGEELQQASAFAAVTFDDQGPLCGKP